MTCGGMDETTSTRVQLTINTYLQAGRPCNTIIWRENKLNKIKMAIVGKATFKGWESGKAALCEMYFHIYDIYI